MGQAGAPLKIARRNWRAVATIATLGVFAWGLAAVIWMHPSGAEAQAGPRFRDVDLEILVPQGGTWYTVRIAFLLHDDGSGAFEQDADAARQQMLANFPGAVELPPGSVSAQYVTSGFKWMSNSAAWSYNNAGEPASVAGTAAAALVGGAAGWTIPDSPFQFAGGGPGGGNTGACGGGTDGSNTVGWAAQGGSVLAVTCTWFGVIGDPWRPAVEFDMEFDPDWAWTAGGATQVDLQSVALHEFGHALGLDHSGPGAVMAPSYSAGSILHTPSQDDVDGVLAIYGSGAPTPTATATATASPTATATPSPSGSSTPLPTPTSMATATPTQPGGGFPTPTPTNTPAPGISPTATATATGTATPAPTNPPSPTPKPSATVTASPTPQPALPIVPGANLLAWPGGSIPPGEALAGIAGSIRIVYEFDAASGQWKRYGPALPGYLNTIHQMRQGGVYWFIATGPATLRFEP